MKRIEVIQWKLRSSDGGGAVTHLAAGDGRAPAAEMVPGISGYLEIPETHDEFIESWLTGTPCRLVAGPHGLKKAA